MRISCCLLLVAIRGINLGSCFAQESGTQEGHGDWQSKLWLSGQLNVVGQIYPAFPASYSGPSSLTANGDAKPTWVATIYTGYEISRHTELFFDLESAKGAGVGGALGLGGLENLDAVTDKNASVGPYIARAMVRYTIPLSDKNIEADRNPLNLATSVPEKRLELRLGKISIADFFDLNGVGSDSHLQFLNYAIDNNAIYDIAANSRGYTYAFLAELYQPNWALRFAEALEPTDSSGQRTQWNLSRGNSENVEIEFHPAITSKRPLTLRALSFFNHTEMGDYQAAVQAFESGRDAAPNLAEHISRSSSWGVGLNGESSLPWGTRVFGRWGWTPGVKESFQFAEADRTFTLGADLTGKRWKRGHDKLGIAVAVNGLSDAHRTYLALGGQSYLLGDGGLQYGREKILETYYNVPLWHGMFGAFDVQRVWNPGYNRARGPVIVFGLRLHLEGDIHFN